MNMTKNSTILTKYAHAVYIEYVPYICINNKQDKLNCRLKAYVISCKEAWVCLKFEGKLNILYILLMFAVN